MKIKSKISATTIASTAAMQSIKLDGSMRKRLKALSGRRNCMMHSLIGAAIEAYLDREERYEREKKEDADRWDAYQTTDHAMDHMRVAKWLKSQACGKDHSRENKG